MVPRKAPRPLAVAAAALLLYVLAFLHGRASGPPSSALNCECTEAMRTLSIRSDASPSDVKDLASCVLHDRPVRGVLHGRLARCLGSSAWKIPARPSQAPSYYSAAAGDYPDDSNSDGLWGGADDAYMEGNANGADGTYDVNAAADGSDGEVLASESTYDEGDAEDAIEAPAEISAAAAAADDDAAASSETDDGYLPPKQQVAGSTMSAEERAARMIDAIRDYEAGDPKPVVAESAASASATPVADATAPPPPPQQSSSSTTKAAAAAPNSTVASAPKRVITYSLYGNTPKYVLGAVRNAETIGKVFPGWTARFYIDLGTVPAEVIAKLRALGAELIPIDMAKHGSQSMFWRFWAAADASVERFISRDVDSRLMPRDAVAVDLWIRSGKAFHVVRDHPSHSLYPMSGGLWGAKRGALPQVMSLISQFPTDSNYLTDMLFLNKLVWPIAMKDVLQHDAFSCVEFDGADGFPVAVDAKGHHVGQVFDAEGNGRANDVQALLDAAQPAACKPGGDPQAARVAMGRPTHPPREQECRAMLLKYGVTPGTTWGTMPQDLQVRWSRLACDPLFE